MKCDFGKDLPKEGEVYKDVVGDAKALQTALEYAKKEWKKKGGRIRVKETIAIGGEMNFPGLEFDSEDNPLIILPEHSIGGATIKGKGQMNFTKAKNLVIYGINFEYQPSGNKDSFVTFKDATACRIARCDFSNDPKMVDAPEHYFLTIQSGERNVIDHNIFHDKKKSLGSFVKIGNDWVKGTVIERNYFFKQALKEMKNSQALRVGESDVGEKAFKTKVRYNLFEECVSDEELITNKSSENLYEYNTFRNNVGSVTFRHGNDNTAQHNVFENNLRGIRVFGKGQQVLNNYFKNVPGGKDVSDQELKDAEVAAIVIGMGGGMYSQALNCKIQGNVIEDTDTKFKKIIMWGAGSGSQKPENISFEHNTIMVNGGTVLESKISFDDHQKGFKNNDIYHKKEKKVDLPKALTAAFNIGELGSLRQLERLQGLKAEEVGPCSQLNEYTFEKDVKRNLK